MSEEKIMFESYAVQDDFGVVRLAQWPEGLVLWVGGRIVWKSWEGPAVPPRDPGAPPDADKRALYAIGPDGKGGDCFLIGLPFQALDDLKSGLSKEVNLARHGIPLRLLLFSGETHAHCLETVTKAFTANGVQVMDDRLPPRGNA